MVVDNIAASRFETTVDGLTAYLSYQRDGTRLVLVHTEVPEELSGRGQGGTLVEAAVDAAADAGLTVAVTCAFARTWLQKHPDVADRVTIDEAPG